MRTLFSRSMAAAVIAAVVFAAAGAGRAQTVTVIHRFAGGTDGANPHAGLAYMGDMLYGTTEVGGSGMGCLNEDIGCGTVFEMTLDGKEVHRHPFRGSPDGAFPYGDLLVVGGDTIYGTTFAGGDTGCGGQGCGTVFRLPHTTVVRRFAGSPNDGANPVAGLTCRPLQDICEHIDEAFGTTRNGGTNNLGTIFRLDTKEPVYSFTAGGDGNYPYGSLVYVAGGFLYGTTLAGGDFTNCGDGCGTFFTIGPGGVEVTEHAFKGGKDDGATPQAGLTYARDGDTLLGTTSAGGGTGCGGAGCGTVFAATLQGDELAKYKFQGGSDGAVPLAGLLLVPGTHNVVYGTTEYGGGKGGDSCPWGGCGTLFEISRKVKVKGGVGVIYSFPGGTDGARPVGKLINVGGTLYGTTYAGGGTGCGGAGCGTVFKVTFP
jgi:hypothetical protein